ncbi:MAG: hypothetical protein ACT4O0_05110 [Pseudonocardia sp.]
MLAGAMSAFAVGIPTDVIDNPLFGRMTPVRWWDYAVLVAVSGLTTLWARIPGSLITRGYRAPLASVFGALAVGCPVCNKLVVGLLGMSGALAIWAPLQPLLGAGSVGLVMLAVLAKWRMLSRDPAVVGSCTSSNDSRLAPSEGGSLPSGCGR